MWILESVYWCLNKIYFGTNFKLKFFRYKLRVADAVIDKINPIRLKIEDYLENPEYLVNVLKIGAEKSSEIAEETLVDVKKKVGLGLDDLHKFQLSEKKSKLKTNLAS